MKTTLNGRGAELGDVTLIRLSIRSRVPCQEVGGWGPDISPVQPVLFFLKLMMKAPMRMAGALESGSRHA